jgi:hypothetical protein
MELFGNYHGYRTISIIESIRQSRITRHLPSKKRKYMYYCILLILLNIFVMASRVTLAIVYHIFWQRNIDKSDRSIKILSDCGSGQKVGAGPDVWGGDSTYSTRRIRYKYMCDLLHDT